MHRTYYQCDHCKKEVLVSEIAHTLNVTISTGTSIYGINYNFHICTQCQDTQNIVPIRIKKDETLETYKDRVYTLLNNLLIEMGVAFEE